MSDATEQGKSDAAKKPPKFEIKVDKQKFEVDKTSITGAEIRALPNPDLPADRDLFLEVPGPAADRLIGADEVVQLEKHMVFFSAPKTITPGADAPGG